MTPMPTFPEELIARDLHEFLRRELCAEKVEVKLKGAGCNWKVEVIGGARRVEVCCFHYGDSANTMMLGIRGNAHLSKVNVAIRHEAHPGPEYYVSLREQESLAATARTQDLDAVVPVLRDWAIGGHDLEKMYRRHAVVDQGRRALVRIADDVNGRLKAMGSAVLVELDGDGESRENGELWFYSGERSGRVAAARDGAVNFAFLAKRTQIMRAEGWKTDEVARAVHAWNDKGATVEDMKVAFPAIHLEPFATSFGRAEYSDWHWGNVLLQASTDSVLAYYLPLLQLIEKNKTVRRFFSFTSMDRLCISRSSLYPFDTDGLPIVVPNRERQGAQYRVILAEDRVEVGSDRYVCDLLERVLSNESAEPYFGNCEDRVCELINQALVAEGCELRMHAVQQRQWQQFYIDGERGRWLMMKFADLNEHGLKATFVSHDNQRRNFSGNAMSFATRIISWFQHL
jgi:hypothetical protein